MNFGTDMNMHMLAVHAPNSAKHLQRKKSSGPGEVVHRRPRTATNDSDSSSATKSSIGNELSEGPFDYRPVYHFNLGNMLHTLVQAVDTDSVRSPQHTSTPTTSPPSYSNVERRRIQERKKNTIKLHDGPSKRAYENRDKKYSDVNRVDMAMRT